MTIDQIKAAINAGSKVHWMNQNYTVFVGKYTGTLYLQCADGQVISLTVGMAKEEFVLDPEACYVA